MGIDFGLIVDIYEIYGQNSENIFNFPYRLYQQSVIIFLNFFRDFLIFHPNVKNFLRSFLNFPFMAENIDQILLFCIPLQISLIFANFARIFISILEVDNR